MSKKIDNIRIIAFAALLFLSISGNGQEIRNYNNYAFAPYLINPALLASNNSIEFNLNLRKQWYGIDGAPEIGTLAIQIPVNSKLALGANLGSDKRGILNTTHGIVTFGYRVQLGSQSNFQHLLGFGLSAGASRTTLDTERVTDFTDPALLNAMDNSFTLEGHFGAFYKNKNLEIGFSLPKLFRPNYTQGGFGEIILEPLSYTHGFLKYTFRLSDDIQIQPWLSVRTYDNIDPDYEILGLINLKDIVTLGTSYRYNKGPAFYVGIRLGSKIRSSYSYELANNQVPGFSQGTHELNITALFGESTTPPPVDDEEQEEEMNEEIISEEVVEEPAKVVEKPAEPTEVKKDSTDRVDPVDPVKVEQTPIIETPPVEKQRPQPESPVVEVEPLIETTDNSREFTKGQHYLVVGVFMNERNAEEYSNTIAEIGRSAFIKYNPSIGYYYVVLSKSTSLEALRQERTKVRNENTLTFRDAWVYTHQ